jgi:integrase/recombinase XerD
MDVLRACDAFVSFCENVRQLSTHTIRAYHLDLHRFAAFAGATTLVASCERGLLHAYVEALFGTFHLKPTSAKRHIASVRALFRWLEEQEIIPEDPFRHARVKIKVPRRLPRLLTRAEVRAMLNAPTGESVEEVTGRVAAELLFGTGVRVAELTNLRDADVDLEAGVITIVGKGDRQRRVYIPDDAVIELLRSYRRARPAHHQDSATFLVTARGTMTTPDMIRRLISRRAADAKLERRVTPHMFRHSLATYLLEEGVDIRYVQRLLGHRSISTTEIYTHVADGVLKTRVLQCHPRKAIIAET